MNELLTDDEIVALASTAKLDWPVELFTVDRYSVEGMSAAAFRGLRSLIARGLAAADEDTLSVNREVSEPVLAAAQADQVIVAHISPVHEVKISGSSVVAFCGNQSLQLDVVTHLGVHAIGASTMAEAMTSFLGFIASRFDLRGVDSELDTCVIIGKSGEPDKMFRVTLASVETGQVEEIDGKYVFRATEPASESLAGIEAFLHECLLGQQ